MKINENEDLLALKIDIHSDDDRSFLEMATLFDKPDFIKMLPMLRKDFEIKNLITLKEFGDKVKPFYSRNHNLIGKKPTIYDDIHSTKDKLINFSKYKNVEELKKFARDNAINDDSNLEGKMTLQQMIDTEVSLTCLQFQRPPYFIPAIKQAIFCGAADGRYFSPTFWYVIRKDNISSTIGYFQLPRVAIFISQSTTHNDLKYAYISAKKLKRFSHEFTYNRPKVDIVNNIRKYRYFYWKKLEGLTMEKVADNWVESQLPKEDYTTYIDVIKGIKTYKELLEI